MRLNHPIQKHITLNTINQIKFLNTIINRLSSNLKAIEKKNTKYTSPSDIRAEQPLARARVRLVLLYERSRTISYTSRAMNTSYELFLQP